MSGKQKMLPARAPWAIKRYPHCKCYHIFYLERVWSAHNYDKKDADATQFPIDEKNWQALVPSLVVQEIHSGIGKPWETVDLKLKPLKTPSRPGNYPGLLK